MDRKEMIEELLEKLDSELCELTNVQLSFLLNEFEDMPILTVIVENCDVPEEIEDDVIEDDDGDEMTLIDGEWSTD